MLQSLRDTDVSVLQLNILANYGDRYFAVIMFQYPLYHFMPVRHIFGLIRHIQLFERDSIQSLLFHQHRHLVNAGRCQVLDHSLRINVTEHSHFFAHILRNRTLAAADDNIRRNTDAAQFFNTVLGRLGFQLACSSDIRNKSHMDIQNIVAVNFLFDLTDSLQER